MFHACRSQFKAGSHGTLRQACMAANRFLQCGQSVLWSHDFSLDTYQLHAELMRNRAVYWQHCAMRALFRGGVGRGMCPFDVTVKLASCLNMTYWQPVAPGDVKTFCRVVVETVPCLGELANGCQHVPPLQNIADFMWSSFGLLRSQCRHLEPSHDHMVYEYGDYDVDPLEDSAPEPLRKPTTPGPKSEKPRPATHPPGHHKPKSPRKHDPEPEVSKVKGSKLVQGRDDQKKVSQEKPPAGFRPNEAEMSKNKDDADSAQKHEKAHNSSDQDKNEMGSVSRSKSNKPNKGPKSKAQGELGSSPDCYDEDNKDFQGKKGKASRKMKLGKQGDILPCSSSQNNGRGNRTREQLPGSSSRNNRRTTPPTYPKRTPSMVSAESSSLHVPSATTLIKSLLTTETPTRLPEKQSASRHSSPPSDFSTHTASQPADFYNSTPPSDTSLQPADFNNSTPPSQSSLQSANLNNSTPPSHTSLQSADIYNSTPPNQNADNTAAVVADVDLSTDARNDSKLPESDNEGEAVENELHSIKSTVAWQDQADTPENAPMIDASTPAADLDEFMDHKNTSLLPDKGAEEVADWLLRNNHSAINQSGESSKSTRLSLNVTTDNPRTTTFNITVQNHDNVQIQNASNGPEDEDGEESMGGLPTKYPTEMEGQNSSETVTASAPSKSIQQDSNETRLDNKEKGDSSLPVSPPDSGIESSNESSEVRMGEESRQNVTNRTMPSPGNQTDSPAGTSVSELFKTTATAFPDNTTHILLASNVSLENDGAERSSDEDLTTAESPADDSGAKSEPKPELSSSPKQNASDLNTTEENAAIHISIDSLVTNNVQPNRTDSQSNDSVNPAEVSKPNETQAVRQRSGQNKDQAADEHSTAKPKRAADPLVKPASSAADSPDPTTTTTTTTTVTSSQTSSQYDVGKDDDHSLLKEGPHDVELSSQAATKATSTANGAEVAEPPEAEMEQHGVTAEPTTVSGMARPEKGESGLNAPWGENRSHPCWKEHERCTAIMMQARLTNHQLVCRSLYNYTVCLNKLLEACRGFQDFKTIIGTVNYVTSVFDSKCRVDGLLGELKETPPPRSPLSP